MDQEPQQPTDDQPKLFKSMHGWIAGATGLVVALGGLAATWDRIFPARPAEPQAAAASTEAAPQAQAAEEPAAEPDAGDPTLYKGEMVEGGKVVTIEWDGESWVVTE